MKQVAVVGMGLSPDTLTAEGLRAITLAQVLLGARRLLDSFPGRKAFAEYSGDRVREIVARENAERFAVLVSGDTGFYSAASGIFTALQSLPECEVRLIPGISSLSAFFARLGKAYEGAALISLHGRHGNFVDAVRRNRQTFALTGGNAAELAKALRGAGLGRLQLWVGENLGLPDERVFSCAASELREAKPGALTVLLAENPAADRRVRVGIPDGAFRRGEVPMTKAPVRAAIAGALALSPEMICLDLGAGTGSVTVEMALAAYEGHVYAVDRNPEAIRLIRENCRAFHIGNVDAVQGDNLSALADLPAPDAAFIGGSSGDMEETIAALLKKNPRVRIAATAIALETAAETVRAMERGGLLPEITQIHTARGRRAGRLHMLLSDNPVFLISGGGERPEVPAGNAPGEIPENSGAAGEDAL